jgi:hypothetical protein
MKNKKDNSNNDEIKNDEIKQEITNEINEKEEIPEESNFIQIPNDNSKRSLFIAIGIIVVIVVVTILLMLKDVIFPTFKEKIPKPDFPTLAFNLETEYIVNNDIFDSEKADTY